MDGLESDAALDLVRRVSLALPETNERASHGAPTFFVRDKKAFVMFHDDHHGDGILGIWCAAPVGVQATLIDAEPDRFYRPAYVGHRGWLGVRLDRDVDPDELEQIIEDAYRCVAPATLLKLLDQQQDQ